MDDDRMDDDRMDDAHAKPLPQQQSNRRILPPTAPVGAVLGDIAELLETERTGLYVRSPQTQLATIRDAVVAAQANPTAASIDIALTHLYYSRYVQIVQERLLGSVLILRHHAGVERWGFMPMMARTLTTLCMQAAGTHFLRPLTTSVLGCITLDGDTLYVADHLLREMVSDHDVDGQNRWYFCDKDPSVRDLMEATSPGNQRLAKLVHRWIEYLSVGPPRQRWIVSSRFVTAVPAHGLSRKRIEQFGDAGTRLIAAVREIMPLSPDMLVRSTPTHVWPDTGYADRADYLILTAAMPQTEMRGHPQTAERFDEMSLRFQRYAPGRPPVVGFLVLLSTLATKTIANIGYQQRDDLSQDGGWQVYMPAKSRSRSAYGIALGPNGAIAIAMGTIVEAMHRTGLVPEIAVGRSVMANIPGSSLLRGGFVQLTLGHVTWCQEPTPERLAALQENGGEATVDADDLGGLWAAWRPDGTGAPPGWITPSLASIMSATSRPQVPEPLVPFDPAA